MRKVFFLSFLPGINKIEVPSGRNFFVFFCQSTGNQLIHDRS